MRGRLHPALQWQAIELHLDTDAKDNTSTPKSVDVAGGEPARGSPVKVSGASAADMLKQRLRDSSPTLSRGEGPTLSHQTASESEVSQVDPTLPPCNVPHPAM